MWPSRNDILHFCIYNFASIDVALKKLKKIKQNSASNHAEITWSIIYKTPDHAPLSDHFCCLGRVPYGIRQYSTRCVRHGTITHVGTVQQTRDVIKSEQVQKSGRNMILACTVPPGVRPYTSRDCCAIHPVIITLNRSLLLHYLEFIIVSDNTN